MKGGGTDVVFASWFSSHGACAWGIIKKELKKTGSIGSLSDMG